MIHCVIYLAIVGILAFFIGRMLPRTWFHADTFPFRAFAFEKNGRFYDRFHISHWKDILPDMSRIFPSLIMPKKVTGRMNASEVEQLIQETCVAEFVHMIEKRQGVKISAPEEIAYRYKWIDRATLFEAAEKYGKSPYGPHLRNVAEERLISSVSAK